MVFLRKIQEGLSTSIPSITIDDIKEKLHKLRTQYQKERKKNKKIVDILSVRHFVCRHFVCRHSVLQPLE